ncbi:MAG: N-formylglutamate amidohydrolase [Polyangiaceae bacterium]
MRASTQAHEQAYFTVFEPRGAETPLVVEVPHAGLGVPAPFVADLMAPVRSLGRDADLHVDRLYADAPDFGATMLVANVSRYVVDLNRAETDWDRDGARMPRGLVWHLTTDGEKCLSRPLQRSDVDARLDLVHRPYHATLKRLLDEKKSRFGIAILLAAHSMPSLGRGGVARADVVPGTQGRTTASARFIDVVDAHAQLQSWSVRHDEPYKGGYSTRIYGRPIDGFHAVQVELARRLYMDESTLFPSKSFDQMRTWCAALVEKLGQTALR